MSRFCERGLDILVSVMYSRAWDEGEMRKKRAKLNEEWDQSNVK